MTARFSGGVGRRGAGSLFFIALALAAALPACERGPAPPVGDLASRGKLVYQANCIACHNSDPRKAGSLGPEIFGSPLALIEARVLRKEYPPGYKPKRETRIMTPLPQLKDDLPALHAYLNP